MHGFRTIVGMNQRNTEAAKIVEKNENNGTYEAQGAKFAADIKEAQTRLAQGRVATA